MRIQVYWHYLAMPIFEVMRKIRFHAKLKLQMRIFLMQQNFNIYAIFEKFVFFCWRSSHFWPLNLFFTVHFSKGKCFWPQNTLRYQIKVHFRPWKKNMVRCRLWVMLPILRRFSSIFLVSNPSKFRFLWRNKTWILMLHVYDIEKMGIFTVLR